MKLHVGIDVDGVIRDLVPSVRREYVRAYPDREKYLIDIDDFDKWNIRNLATDPKIGQHIEHMALKDPSFSFRCFVNADPIPNQVNQVRYLYDKVKSNDDILSICTSQGSSWKRASTLVWLNHHDVLHDDLIMTNSGKGHFGLDFHFDDRVKHCESVKQTGIHGVLKSRRYNMEKEYSVRADSVKEYTDFIYDAQ